MDQQTQTIGSLYADNRTWLQALCEVVLCRHALEEQQAVSALCELFAARNVDAFCRAIGLAESRHIDSLGAVLRESGLGVAVLDNPLMRFQGGQTFGPFGQRLLQLSTVGDDRQQVLLTLSICQGTGQAQVDCPLRLSADDALLNLNLAMAAERRRASL